jgi:hypothetical protein
MKLSDISRRTAIASIAGAFALAARESEWVSLFDGKTLEGWKASENPGSWRVEDRCLVANGARSHLFYSGPVEGARFRNFEFEAEVMTMPGANSGIYFHTEYQEKGFPNKGHEIQINNTHRGEGRYIERKKTGSLYGVRNQYKTLVRDNEWFRMNLAVRGKNVQVRVNGTLVVDFTEPEAPMLSDDGRGRLITSGTFGLQGHDPGSKVHFRNVRVRPLSENAEASGARPAASDELARDLLMLGARNYPVVDYHVHLKGDLSLDQVLERSRATGIFCGIAINCGKGFPVQDEATARAFVDGLKGKPVFTAMQAEGREWVDMFSRSTVGLFDYVFTDSMTWTDNRGRRMRTWIAREVGAIADPQEFMETLVDRAVGILEREPIDIYVNPTFLPDVIAKDYDTLWTEERMRKVLRAAKSGDVALELNDRYRLPGEKFVRMAKEEGLKFAFGTNNGGAEDLRRCNYGVEMVKKCGLQWEDFFVPRPIGERGVDRKDGMLKA